MLVDGRQSARALAVQRGVQRRFVAQGLVALPEVTLANGRRADLVALDRAGLVHIVEIKSSVEDYRTDRKWPEYRLFCDRFSFATLPDVPEDIFPAEAGLLVADAYGAHELRAAPLHPLPAATRKALLVRLARLATARLLALEDPDMALDAEGMG
jgi:hypothetical protein